MLAIFNDAQEVLRYRELLFNLVIRDIKVRYKRSVLGFLWVMLNPLLMMLVLTIVFSQLFGATTKNFAVYVLSGLILWGFFAQSTSVATHSFMASSNLLKKVYIPKALFPLSAVSSSLVNFSFSLVPLFLIMLLSGTDISTRIILLPLVALLMVLFPFGIALILATLAVFFHDVIYIRSFYPGLDVCHTGLLSRIYYPWPVYLAAKTQPDVLFYEYLSDLPLQPLPLSYPVYFL